VQAALVVVEHEQLDRLVAQELAAKLRANRASRSRDQDYFAGDGTGVHALVPLHRLAAQQVLGADVAQRRDVRLGIYLGEEVGNQLDARAGLLALGEHGAKVGPADSVDGDDDQLNIELLDQIGNVGAGAEHLAALNVHMELTGVVIHIADHFVVVLVVGRAMLQAPGGRLAGIASADDEHPRTLLWKLLVPDGLPAPGQAADQAGTVAHGDKAHQRHAIADNNHTQGHRAGPPEEVKGDKHCGRQGHPIDKHRHVVAAGARPQAVITTRHEQGQHHHRDGQGHELNSLLSQFREGARRAH